MDLPRQVRALALVLAVLTVGALGVGASARADYRPGSIHHILARERLALPLPRLGIPQVRLTRDGRLRVSARVRYRAANWRGSDHVARDRVMVTLSVARRQFTTGPDRADPIFRHTIVHLLHHRKVSRRYSVLLPRRASRMLIRRGVFAKKARRRAHVLRLVSVDVQQDRDFRRVDGRYDWREGTAYSAGDRLLARLREGTLRSGAAHASSGYRAPTGTLTLIDNTAAGVYCQSGCPLVEEGGTMPGTLPGTINNSRYESELAVAGGAVQCFDQGSNGSDPEGFANFDAAQVPQPYQPGESIPGDGVIANTTGTAITEGLAADYTLAWAPAEEIADKTGLEQGLIKLSINTIKFAAKGSISPGAVITSVLGIFEFFLQNSCKETGNTFNITAADPAGGAASETIDTDDGNWSTYPGTGDTPYGLQMNPSLVSYEGNPLRLVPQAALTPGLADNACIGCSSNNVVELGWDDYDPCPSGEDCAARPPGSPTVESPVGEVDCGRGNVRCPFPAAGWPTQPQGPPIFVGLSSGTIWRCNTTSITNCVVLDKTEGSYISSLAVGEGALWAGNSSGELLKCPVGAANECQTFDDAGSHNGINAVIFSRGSVYVGISNGILWKCSATLRNECTDLDDADGDSIDSLAVAGNGQVFAGRHSGILWSCSPTDTNDCLELDNAGKDNSIASLSAGAHGKVFAAISNGVVWECGTGFAECLTLGRAPSPVTSVAYAGGGVFAAFEQASDETPRFWRCTPGQAGSCQNWAGAFATRLFGAGNYLFVGADQNLLRCSATAAEECATLDETNTPATGKTVEKSTVIDSLVVPTSR